MVTDGRFKELRRLLNLSRTLAASARMTEMSEKTARKYRVTWPMQCVSRPRSREHYPVLWLL